MCSKRHISAVPLYTAHNNIAAVSYAAAAPTEYRLQCTIGLGCTAVLYAAAVSYTAVMKQQCCS